MSRSTASRSTATSTTSTQTRPRPRKAALRRREPERRAGGQQDQADADQVGPVQVPGRVQQDRRRLAAGRFAARAVSRLR